MSTPDEKVGRTQQQRIDAYLKKTGIKKPWYLARGERDARAKHAKSTALAMDKCWNRFLEYCVLEGHGAAAALPADPVVVLMFGEHMASRTKARRDPETGEHVYDMIPVDEGETAWSSEDGYELSPSYFGSHCAAIAAKHAEKGFEDPTQDPMIVELRQRWTRKAKDRPVAQADPLDDDKLLKVLNAIYEPLEPDRDDAIYALRAAGVGAKAMARLVWDDVVNLDAHGPLVLHATGFTPKGSTEGQVPRDGEIDPALKLMAWQTIAQREGFYAGHRPVFPPIDKKGQPEPDKALSASGLRAASDRRAFGRIHELSHSEVRDAFILLLGLASWFRSDESLRAKWGNLREREGGGLIIYRSSAKNDQTGTGAYSTELPLDSPRLDLKTNMEAWRAVWTDIVGREPKDDDPLLIPVDTWRLRWHRKTRKESETGKGRKVTETEQGPKPKGRGWKLQPLGYGAMNDMIGRRTAKAGLKGRYTTHSLRAGGAANAFNDGVDAIQVAHRGLWKDSKSPVIYARGGKAERKGSAESLRKLRLDNPGLTAEELAILAAKHSNS